MVKTRKIMLTVLTAIMLVCVAILGVMHINVGSTNAAAATSTVVCQGIANDMNNNILEEGNPARYRTLLKYDLTLGTEANATNVVSTTGQGIKLNGVKLSDIPNALIDYAHGKGYVEIKIPQSYQDALTGDIVLEVVEGTPFESQILDSATFALKEGKWQKVSQVAFSQIRWNDMGYNQFVNMNGVLLEFSGNLSNNASEVNGGIADTNLASTVGEGIYLGGAKLSTLPGALISYYMQNFMYVYADGMSTYRTLTVKSGTLMRDSALPEVNLYFHGSTSQWSTSPQTTFTPVTFTGIQWNNIGYAPFEGKNGVLLQFSGNLSNLVREYNGSAIQLNLAKTTIGEKITLGGTALKDIAGAEICYHSQGFLWVYAPNMTNLGNLAVESTNFLDVTLPNVNLAFDGTAWGTYVPPAAPTVVCQGIANDVNNNILETVAMGNPEPRYRTLLAYDIALGTEANAVDVVSTVGQGFKLNGVKLSEIPNASIDYAHGSRYIRIKIPQSYQDALVGDVILEVVAGTAFENQILDGAKFILRNGQWVSHKQTAVSFVQIQWNDMDYDFYGGKKGVLLNFSGNLSAAQSEIDGGIRSNNFASTVGEHIYLGGAKLSTLPGALVSYHSQNFLFIYADNMSMFRTLTIEEGTAMLNAILPEVNLYYGANQWSTTKPTNLTNVTLAGIEWNNIGYAPFEGKNGVLLRFSGYLSTLPQECNGGAMSVNLVKASIGEKVKLGGTALQDIAGAEIHYHSQGFLWIYAPNMTTMGILSLETTSFFDVILPDVELSFNGTQWNTYVGEVRPTAVCQGIANDVNNNILETVAQGNPFPRYRTLLKYDVTLGTEASSVNVVATTGQGILLNGVKLSEIPNASIDYGHGKTYIQIRIPQDYQDALTGDIILEVLEGTTFENQVLDYAKFVLRNGQWATYKEPEPMSLAAIMWNNYGADVHAGKNGVLLSYSDYLSNVPNEVNGDMKTVNYVTAEIGEKIKLDGTPLKDIAGAEIMYFGTSLLWIYAPNMDTYQELTIETTGFLVAILPETRLALFGSQWAESFKITHTINGVERVTYTKKNSNAALGAEYYAALFAEEDLAVKLVCFQVGETVYGPEDTFVIDGDLVVTATVVGYQTTDGAAVRLLTPTGIRYETKIDKATYDYLVGLYGTANIETGTYIVPRSYLGFTEFAAYFADGANVDGEDYVKIVNEGFNNAATAETDGFYKYYGSLVDIFPHNYCTEFFGIGYIKFFDGVNEYIVYGGNDLETYTRSIYQVSQLAYKDYAIGSAYEKALKSYIDGVVSLVSGADGLEIENVSDVAKDYSSPYSIDYDSASGEYTISGAAEIKSVLLNGMKMSKGTNIITINDAAYKIMDYVLNATANSSTATFKLLPDVEASSFVDFTVEIPSNREARILQLTDTQVIDASQMRSPTRLNEIQAGWWARGNIDKNCFNYITELVENERPDLIVLTGDIVYGEFDDSGIIWTRIVEFMDSFNIPWAPVFGNHDNETAKGVAWQCEQLEKAENCLFKRGDVTGNGNYSIGLVDENGKIRRVIYMMDSHGYSIGAGLAQDQIDWFKGVAASIDAAYGEKVPAFACYHIASLDFQTAYVEKYGYSANATFNLDETGRDGDFGQKSEELSMFPTTLAPDLKAANVEGVFIGHDHRNNYSIEHDGIRYTYGTKSGTYDSHNTNNVGGTLIQVMADGRFKVSHKYLNIDEMSNRESASMVVTFMSDLHFDSNDYGDFHCTDAETKLSHIINETQGSRFYVNLGDTVNSLPNGLLNNFYDAISAMKSHNLNVYNSEGKGYTEGNRMMYNLIGNHEAAYADKSAFKDGAPYVEGIGSAAVFKQGDLMFVAVDANFTRDGSDAPEDILPCREFTIPDAQIDWLTAEVASQMDSSVKGIVWISHIALQDIDAESQGKLLGELKAYGLPMSVFEGHTHIEAYRELTDAITGEVYCKVYTLPAVTLFDNYPYYNVTFINGEVWYVDKHTTGVISAN